MGLWSWLFAGRGQGVGELARRLDLDVASLNAVQPQYREFRIAKRSGGQRRILAPDDTLKMLQRRILRRLFARLAVHPAAMGFERGRSIVTNARPHCGQAVVLRFDLVDFFSNTGLARLRRYFRRIGWNRPATELLLRLCMYEGGLPQGAPTSPRLSNLVNYRLDARLAAMAARLGAVYTRYADDITVSFAADAPHKIHFMQRFLHRVLQAEGYTLHRRKKLSLRRRHHRQMVTGLVVNQQVNLPRPLRRWLRAVEHRMRTAGPGALLSSEPLSRPPKPPTLSQSQLEGWQALRHMVERDAD